MGCWFGTRSRRYNFWNNKLRFSTYRLEKKNALGVSFAKIKIYWKFLKLKFLSSFVPNAGYQDSRLRIQRHVKCNRNKYWGREGSQNYKEKLKKMTYHYQYRSAGQITLKILQFRNSKLLSIHIELLKDSIACINCSIKVNTLSLTVYNVSINFNNTPSKHFGIAQFSQILLSKVNVLFFMKMLYVCNMYMCSTYT